LTEREKLFLQKRVITWFDEVIGTNKHLYEFIMAKMEYVPNAEASQTLENAKFYLKKAEEMRTTIDQLYTVLSCTGNFEYLDVVNSYTEHIENVETSLQAKLMAAYGIIDTFGSFENLFEVDSSKTRKDTSNQDSSKSDDRISFIFFFGLRGFFLLIRVL